MISKVIFFLFMGPVLFCQNQNGLYFLRHQLLLILVLLLAHLVFFPSPEVSNDQSDAVYGAGLNPLWVWHGKKYAISHCQTAFCFTKCQCKIKFDTLFINKPHWQNQYHTYTKRKLIAMWMSIWENKESEHMAIQSILFVQHIYIVAHLKAAWF